MTIAADGSCDVFLQSPLLAQATIINAHTGLHREFRGLTGCKYRATAVNNRRTVLTHNRLQCNGSPSAGYPGKCPHSEAEAARCDCDRTLTVMTRLDQSNSLIIVDVIVVYDPLSINRSHSLVINTRRHTHTLMTSLLLATNHQ